EESSSFTKPLISRLNNIPISTTTEPITIYCFVFISILFYLRINCFSFFVSYFYFIHKSFCWLKARNKMFWNNNSCILRDISRCFFRSFLYNKTTKSSNINILSINHRVFYYFEKRFYRFLYIYLLNSGLISNFCNNFCLCHVLYVFFIFSFPLIWGCKSRAFIGIREIKNLNFLFQPPIIQHLSILAMNIRL